MGAGKTEFARGFLRRYTSIPNLLVTSPTFTLDITYDYGGRRYVLPHCWCAYVADVLGDDTFSPRSVPRELCSCGYFYSDNHPALPVLLPRQYALNIHLYTHFPFALVLFVVCLLAYTTWICTDYRSPQSLLF